MHRALLHTGMLPHHCCRPPPTLPTHPPICILPPARPAAERTPNAALPPCPVPLPQVSFMNDDVSVWRLKVTSFDTDTPAGQRLNADLATLGRLHGLDAACVLLEIRSVC